MTRRSWSISSPDGGVRLVHCSGATQEEQAKALSVDSPFAGLVRHWFSDQWSNGVFLRTRLDAICNMLPLSGIFFRRDKDTQLDRLAEALSCRILLAVPQPHGAGSWGPHKRKDGPIDPPKPKPTPKPEEAVTVEIKAENGKDAPPAVVGCALELKLKGVPSKGSGTYEWSTSSTLVTLKNATQQTVTVVAGKKASAAPAAEEIVLVFTPAGKPKLGPEKHALAVARAVFAKEASHAWGYDAHEKMKCRDKDNKDTEPTPDPALDFVSIKKGKMGKVKLSLFGAKPSEVFLGSTNESVCKPKLVNPTGSTVVLEIEAKNQSKAEAQIEAHLLSPTGPVLAKVGVVVLQELEYRATLFRVKDSTSPKTALGLTFKGTDLVPSLDGYYKQGVAKWQVDGGASEQDVAYDLIGNGKLDMEPGTVTDEQKKIIAACTSKNTRVIYVHQLRWCYYLTKDVDAKDTTLTLKNYGTTYLGYIGATQSYVIDDKKGQSVSITVKSVDTAKGVVTLTGPLGKSFKASDKAALIFPLGGLSGDPLWVGDMSSLGTLQNYVAHELGHQVASFDDVCERDNLMHGGPETGSKLRHRPIARYYEPSKTEEQWKKMKGR